MIVLPFSFQPLLSSLMKYWNGSFKAIALPITRLSNNSLRPVVKTHTPNAGDMGLIPGQGTKILRAVRYGRIK